MNESSPDDIAALEAELAEAERRVVRRIDPGTTALPVAIAVLVLLGSLMLPWTGGVAGWEILAGVANLGLLPRLFTFTAVLFGVLGSAVTLAGRHWAAAWTCAVGCGFSVVNGVWAIWSRQVNVPTGARARESASSWRWSPWWCWPVLGEDRRPPGLTSSRA